MSTMWYRQAEKMMYEYLDNDERIKVYEDALQDARVHGDIHVQSYKSAYGAGSSAGDAVGDYVHKVHQLETAIMRLRPAVEAVRKVYDYALKFRPELKAVIEHVYFEKRNAYGIAGVDDGEVKSLRYELCQRVSREFWRYRDMCIKNDSNKKVL